jgi:methionyl-tRNA synthetase
LAQLGIKAEDSNWSISDATWGGLKSGSCISEIQAVYPRLDINEFDESKKAETASEVSPDRKIPERPSNLISIDDFAKVEMKVAQILKAERVPKSSKLLKIVVDLGYEKRQIVAGIGKAYQPEALTGKKVVVVTNLDPVKLMGVESNGMIVAASEKGRPVLVTFNEEVALGTRLR